ncbi:MAG TPA: ATP-binding protein [Bryobacteraceae bacterium]|nr:ATP-binding protein [Bryobacteraceae bacterium]
MSSDTGSNGIFDRDYPSTLESVDTVEVDVLKAAVDVGFGEDEQHGIGMAVRECMVNAVVHGNRYNKNKHVHVNVRKSAGDFEVRIRDEGEGFDHSQVPDPLDEANVLRHSGRGLFLMGAFMDDVKVEKASPYGTEVTLSKKLAS